MKECSCQFNTVAEFQFSQLMDSSRHAAARLRDVNDFVAEQSQLGYLEEGKKVGTREAAAMQRMDTDRMASKIVDRGQATSPVAVMPVTQAGS